MIVAAQISRIEGLNVFIGKNQIALFRVEDDHQQDSGMVVQSMLHAINGIGDLGDYYHIGIHGHPGKTFQLLGLNIEIVEPCKKASLNQENLIKALKRYRKLDIAVILKSIVDDVPEWPEAPEIIKPGKIRRSCLKCGKPMSSIFRTEVMRLGSRRTLCQNCERGEQANCNEKINCETCNDKFFYNSNLTSIGFAMKFHRYRHIPGRGYFCKSCYERLKVEGAHEIQGLDNIVNEAISSLECRTAQIIEMYYGFEPEQYTLEGIAKRIELTTERTRQLKNKGLRSLFRNRKLREALGLSQKDNY